jgi:DmsE family decaheme c-type cytochrome
MKIHTWLKAGAEMVAVLTLVFVSGSTFASDESVESAAHAAFNNISDVSGKNEGATYVGPEVCGRCHSLEDKHFAGTTHAKVFANPKNALEAKVCEACHGPGSKHAENAADHKLLIGFTREWGTPIETQTGQCLQCHKGGQRINWMGSAHQKNKLSCSDCHNPMAKNSQTGLMKKPSIVETCMTCHQEKKAEFSRRSHMPLLEGKMTCDDCHNPHGSTTRSLLKANTVAETCYQCHAEKRGPFLFEHPPVRQGDQCLNCHLPHGSNQEKLLMVARPMLCQQCHDPGAPHDRTINFVSNGAGSPGGTAAAGNSATGIDARLVGHSCTDCHAEIHGSNSPSGARWHR